METGNLLKCFSAWEGNYTFDSFIIFSWNNSGGELLLVCVNYSDNQSQCYVRLDEISSGAMAVERSYE